MIGRKFQVNHGQRFAFPLEPIFVIILSATMSLPSPAVSLLAGRLLKAAREQRSLSLEDAAHLTKIPVQRLIWLENDNYAAFGCFTYARSFLKKYSVFLGVDAHDLLESLPSGRLAGAHDYRHLSLRHGMWPESAQSSSTSAAKKPPRVAAQQPLGVVILMSGLLLSGTLLWGFHLATSRQLQPVHERQLPSPSATHSIGSAPAVGMSHTLAEAARR